jgi:hypothetical protein
MADMVIRSGMLQRPELNRKLQQKEVVQSAGWYRFVMLQVVSDFWGSVTLSGNVCPRFWDPKCPEVSVPSKKYDIKMETK